MKLPEKILIFGFLTWLIPFLIAIPLYSPSGEPAIDEGLFKSIMIITGAATGAILLWKIYTVPMDHPMRQGIIIGIVWLLMNWMLDGIILLPLSHMSVSRYFFDIGLRYLMIPIMSTLVGAITATVVERLKPNT